VYQDLSELPFEECDVWLYTAEWDGVPNILIEVASRAVPLVGSIAGGTGEILKRGMSWPVEDIEDIASYEKGIRAALENPEEARSQARSLREYVLSRRAPEVYGQALNSLLDSTSPRARDVSA
jgi:glycosyltransferase involved in cell wall biosynthesis